MIEKLTFFHVFHDQEEMFGSLNDLIKLYDIRVPDKFKDMYFSWNPLYISYINNFIFFQYLYRYFLTSWKMSC